VKKKKEQKDKLGSAKFYTESYRTNPTKNMNSPPVLVEFVLIRYARVSMYAPHVTPVTLLLLQTR